MNRLISRSLFLSLKSVKLTPSYISKHCYATFDSSEPVSNANGRLRIGESDYCNQVSTPFKQPYGDILEALNKKTEEDFSNPHMMVCQAQAKFLHQLIGILRPKNVLEIGGFTGYSAIAMGSALLPDSNLLSLELDPKHIAVATHFINEADLQSRVSIKEGPAGDRYTSCKQTSM